MNNFENEAISKFEKIAKDKNLETFSGQYKKNRISINNSNIYFQFGDLRIDTPTSHVIIEIESSGGVTNLVKYWYIIKNNLVQKKIILIHLYKINSDNDYQSHIKLWEFLSEKIKKDCGEDKIVTSIFIYKIADSSDDGFNKALKYFENVFKSGGG